MSLSRCYIKGPFYPLRSRLQCPSDTCHPFAKPLPTEAYGLKGGYFSNSYQKLPSINISPITKDARYLLFVVKYDLISRNDSFSKTPSHLALGCGRVLRHSLPAAWSPTGRTAASLPQVGVGGPSHAQLYSRVLFKMQNHPNCTNSFVSRGKENSRGRDSSLNKNSWQVFFSQGLYK